MDTPAAGRGPVGARARRPVRRPSCAPALPAPRRRHHHPEALAKTTDVSGLSQVADAAMARDAGMGYPAVSSVAWGDLIEKHCRTREVMPPPMITTRQRLQCVAHIDADVASPRPIQRSESVGARTATGGGIFEVERAQRRCHPRAGRRPRLPGRPVGRPGIPMTSISPRWLLVDRVPGSHRT